EALQSFLDSGDAFSGSTQPDKAGNGSLMRLAPIAMRYARDADLDRYAAESSRTTHGAHEAVECCVLFARMLAAALGGAPRDAVLRGHGQGIVSPGVQAIARGEYEGK